MGQVFKILLKYVDFSRLKKKGWVYKVMLWYAIILLRIAQGMKL